MAADGVTPVGCLLGGMTAAGWLLCKWLVENWRPGNNGAPRCAADGVPQSRHSTIAFFLD